MAIALLAKLRSLHTAAIQYPYIVITLPRIIAISSHTYVSRTIRLEPALTYLRLHMGMLYAHDREKGIAVGSHGFTTVSRVAKHKRNHLFLKVKYEVLKIVEKASCVA